MRRVLERGGGRIRDTFDELRVRYVDTADAAMPANLNTPDGLFHLERSLFSRLPLKKGVLQLLYWGTPIVFSDADLEDGLLEGDTVRLTFGGGIGVLAVDRLADLGGTLATLSPAATQALNAALPPIWSGANPVDIAGDADPARYAKALETLLDDKDNDAILVMNVPTALASAAEAAKSVVAVTRQHCNTLVPAKPVLAVWVGGEPLERRHRPLLAGGRPGAE